MIKHNYSAECFFGRRTLYELLTKNLCNLLETEIAYKTSWPIDKAVSHELQRLLETALESGIDRDEW